MNWREFSIELAGLLVWPVTIIVSLWWLHGRGYLAKIIDSTESVETPVGKWVRSRAGLIEAAKIAELVGDVQSGDGDVHADRETTSPRGPAPAPNEAHVSPTGSAGSRAARPTVEVEQRSKPDKLLLLWDLKFSSSNPRRPERIAEEVGDFVDDTLTATLRERLKADSIVEPALVRAEAVNRGLITRSEFLAFETASGARDQVANGSAITTFEAKEIRSMVDTAVRSVVDRLS